MQVSSYPSGYVTDKGAVHAPTLDPRFTGPMIDADLALELREQEVCGCPLCLTSNPSSSPDAKCRRYDQIVGEAFLLADKHDFRDDLDEEKLEFEFHQGEIVVRGCTEQMVFWLQRMVGTFVCAIEKVVEGIYDIFFRKEARGQLLPFSPA